ncbi:hypothetical protein K0I63_12755 [Shewanella rhizosphaerae]|uniref:toxin-antitoxin system YwqK family antitoxin n=1 Tax=Shewanella rhizosphaerae TaxID=2864207 RepID=UPI001C661712|nr:hypothetical protein [Shewanella rhizosphaerae]QYK11645.1 hypothetical protein K0I63_12755 [Shewanella rhizosphaerae]
MQRILLFLLVLCVSSGAAEASIWLDKDWQPTELKSEAKFYLKGPLETLPGSSLGRFRFEPYYLSTNIKQFSGALSSDRLGDNGTHPVGPYRFFASDGALVEQGEFNDLGQRQGLVRIYDEDGKLSCDCQFDRGEREGPQKEYYPTGELKRESIYHQGKPVQQEMVYSPTGAPVRVLCHTGQCSDRFYNPQGQLTMESQKRDGLKHGTETFWQDGKVEVTQAYRDGKEEGDYFAYFQSGQLKQHHRWKNGIKTGEQLNYFEDGRLAKRELLDERGRTESVVEYRDNGERYLEVEYRYLAYGDRQEVRRFYQKEVLVTQIEKHKLRQWRLVSQYLEGEMIGREETIAGKLTGLKIEAKLGGSNRLSDNNKLGANNSHAANNSEAASNKQGRNNQVAWIEKSHYHDGVKQGKAEKRSGDGKLIYQGEYAADKQVGDWVMQSREMRTQCHYNRHGRLDGEYLSLGEAGQVLERIHYRDGELIGKFERYYSDGQIYARGQYLNGQRDGDWIVPPSEGDYSPRPVTRRENWQGRYRAGKQVGKWQRFSAQGYRLAIAKFDEQGRLHGTQYAFYDDGALSRRSEYRHGEPIAAEQSWPYRTQHELIFRR